MEKILVGISKGRGQLTKEDYYIKAIEKAGGEVVLLPPGDITKCNQLRGLMLPGGGDIDPLLYGEINVKSQNIDKERDEWEIQLTKNFFEEEKPILGICRGIQVLNVALGGTLYQDVDNHMQCRHLIRIEEESLLWDILGGKYEIEVNSYHHQAVKSIAPPLKAIAFCLNDGIIEGIEGEGFILGVQFHPERMLEENSLIFNIFKRFVQACKQEIFTVGTSNRKWGDFVSLLKAYSIEEVIDVRRFPISKLQWFKKEEIARSLKDEGISYIWMGEELGGYRSPNYEAYTSTDEFKQGVKKLSHRAFRKRTAIICAEALPWRCHRRYIARALEEKGWKVIHIIDIGKEWRPTEKPPEGSLFNEEV